MRNKIGLSTKRRKGKCPIRLIFSDFGTVFFGWFWWFFCCVFWGGFFFFFGAFSVRCCGRIFFNFLVALPLLFSGLFFAPFGAVFLRLSVLFLSVSDGRFLFFGSFGASLATCRLSCGAGKSGLFFGGKSANNFLMAFAIIGLLVIGFSPMIFYKNLFPVPPNGGQKFFGAFFHCKAVIFFVF